MIELKELLLIFIGASLINNFVFSRYLALCPYIGVSKQTGSAIGMGLAVIFVMSLSSAITWLVYNYILIPFELQYLRTVAFILVIASFVQLLEIIIRKKCPALYRNLGIYLPLITTNCAVMGVAVLNSNAFFVNGAAVHLSFLKSVAQGFGGGAGFMLAMILMSTVRERLDLGEVPESLEGTPIAFICAGLMAMAFLGFA